MRLRTKLWYVSVGNYAELAIVGAYTHSALVLVWGVVGMIGSWYYAEYLRREEENGTAK